MTRYQYVPKRTAHGFHFMMTLLTFGLWLPVWLMTALFNAGKVELKELP